tara:strand:- start:39 stop:251 length:213 start_codon:yes stop_codon:yes gene_type:complete
MSKPTTNPVATETRGESTYQLFSNGELWKAGPHGFMAGHVMDPENITSAIDAHEEEMHFIMADALAEFGP